MQIEQAALRLQLRRCPRALWRRFRQHHYKSKVLSTHATAFACEEEHRCGGAARMGEAAGGALVGFVATIRHNSAEGVARRAHRTVVLPQWQGLGIGARLSDAVAELHRQQQVAYYGQTVHPRFGAYRDASPLWVPTSTKRKEPSGSVPRGMDEERTGGWTRSWVRREPAHP